MTSEGSPEGLRYRCTGVAPLVAQAFRPAKMGAACAFGGGRA